MKKLTATIMILTLALSLNATEYSKEDRLKDMRAMTKSMNYIQKTLIGKCKVCLNSGVMDLKTALRALDSVDAEAYLPKDQAGAHKFATKTAKNIKIYANAMQEAYENKEYFEAMDMYNLMQRQCVSCHLRVRDWDSK